MENYKPGCIWVKSWIGQCCKEPVNNSSYCEEHEKHMCVSCGQKATYDCHETMGPCICGAYLCDDCEHHVGPEGDNQGGTHGKKGKGKYKPWFRLVIE